MKRQLIFVALALALFVVTLILSGENTTTVSAKPAATYMLDWYSIDSGGKMSASGGTYTLSDTIGQADAGTLSGGSYTLAGGFWNALTDVINNYQLNLPLVVR